MALEVFGKQLGLSGGYERPACEKTRTEAMARLKMFQRLLDDGKLRAHPVKALPPGFQSIIDGLKLLRSGNVSGEKLILRID